MSSNEEKNINTQKFHALQSENFMMTAAEKRKFGRNMSGKQREWMKKNFLKQQESIKSYIQESTNEEREQQSAKQKYNQNVVAYNSQRLEAIQKEQRYRIFKNLKAKEAKEAREKKIQQYLAMQNPKKYTSFAGIIGGSLTGISILGYLVT